MGMAAFVSKSNVGEGLSSGPDPTASYGLAAATARKFLFVLFGGSRREAGSHNSLGWPGTQPRSPYPCLSSAGIKVRSHHARPTQAPFKGRIISYFQNGENKSPQEVSDLSAPVFCCITNNHKSIRLQQCMYIVWSFHGVQAQLPNLASLLGVSYCWNQGLFEAKGLLYDHVTVGKMNFLKLSNSMLSCSVEIN